MRGPQVLHARRCHVDGRPVASSCVLLRSGEVQRSSVVASAMNAARRPASLPVQRVSESRAVGNPRESGSSASRHQQSLTVTRTSQASIGRPIVLGSPPSSLGGSHTQPANTGIAAYGCYRLFGPAHISKRGDCLIARLLPGARLELLTGGGSGGAAAAPATATAVEAVAKPPTAAVARSRTVTADAAAAGWRAEADGWDVECACNSDDDDDNEAAAAAGAGGDDGAVAECVLVAAYVELGGSASSVDLVDTALQPAVHHVHGHTYLSVRNLPPGAVITISADGDLSHPVNVTPTPPPEAEVPTPAALASTTATDDRRCGERA